MDALPKVDSKSVFNMINKCLESINAEDEKFMKKLQKIEQDHLKKIDYYYEQAISATSSKPALLFKTPKTKKRNPRFMKAISEDQEMGDSNDEQDSVLSTTLDTYPKRSRASKAQSVSSILESSTESASAPVGRSKRGVVLETSTESVVAPIRRSKREAPLKAFDKIHKQQSTNLNSKIRRPSSSDGSDVPLSKRMLKSSATKVKHSSGSSDSEEKRSSRLSPEERSTKQSSLKDKKVKIARKGRAKFIISDDSEDEVDDSTVLEDKTLKNNMSAKKRKLDEVDEELRIENNERDATEFAKPNATVGESVKRLKTSNRQYHQTLERISEKSKETDSAKSKRTRSKASDVVSGSINDTNDVNEASVYEDAISKPSTGCLPMNSTMNPNSSVTLDKIMSATVVIEPIVKKPVMNETVTLKKHSERVSRSNSTIKSKEEARDVTVQSKKSITDPKLMSNPTVVLQNNHVTELMTDDESSPERKGYTKGNKKRMIRPPMKIEKRITRSTSSISEDEKVASTPMQNKDDSTFKTPLPKYKQPALFSPYAKDSVKKRVQAFEQAALSPKDVSNKAAGRVTRNKTRIMASMDMEVEVLAVPLQSVAQKAARKSLAKAKKISLAKQAKDSDETKENDNGNVLQKYASAGSLERSAQKPQYQKNTPLSKNRGLVAPTSTNRNQLTPSNSMYSMRHMPSSATRGNIITHVDSFINQAPKSAQKRNASQERLAEEKRRRQEEDAKKKRDEMMMAKTEERKRKREEKELKIKLAREAKEKQEMEKRLRIEKEKEEKARQALLHQEKMKEELERKRLAQLQKAHEKEEKRRLEEQLRLQKLREQEEAERALAEQKRREQEAEKRKLAEAKVRNQMHMMQNKPKPLQKAQGQLNYKIDSDPDDEQSDDENKPKHAIPHWATKHVRQKQLAMQRYVPMRSILKFFDVKRTTVDLTEVFKGIDPRKLKRSSSAIWKTPPRYSMMNQSMIRD